MSPATTRARPGFRERLNNRLFDAITSRSLIYNACWEDPAVDRQALQLGPEDRLLVITSAGCNALDYALAGAGAVHAVDANPRQTALLELKLAGINQLEYDDFFALFGYGHHPRVQALYLQALRPRLSPFARQFWDSRWRWFDDPRCSFYFHAGLSGIVARNASRWFRLQPRLHAALHDLFDAKDIETQRRIYDEAVAPRLWNRPVNWMLSRPMTMNLLGVPQSQHRLVDDSHGGRAAGFIRESLEYVVRELPLKNNYFWRVYLTGRYARDCCPEYLTETGFQTLRDGAAERVHPVTSYITPFLQQQGESLTRFVLLDHMDWMAAERPADLIEEWNAILQRAAPGARILLRSAQVGAAFLDTLRVGPANKPLRELLHFQDALAAQLHPQDRVHTYAGFVIADVPA